MNQVNPLIKQIKVQTLSIAGFDPSAGAGVLADIKTFENSGVYGFGVATAMTWQNDMEFEKVEWLDYYKIVQQISVLLRRFDIKYIKIGLIESMHVLHELVDFLHERIKQPVIVYDPVMSASAGFTFHEGGQGLADILHKVYCITPNLPEAELLFGGVNLYDNLLQKSATTNILLKGGHSHGPVSEDILFAGKLAYTFSNPRLPKGAKHGSGCVLSSALTAHLALGNDIAAAAENANCYTYNFLGSNETLLGYHKPSQS